MGYRDEVFQTINSLVGFNNILTIPKSFIDYTGNIETALLLSQLVYWTDRASNKDGWIYKTYSEWENEIGLSEYKVRKASKALIKLGILETKVKKANGVPTVHYRIKKASFSESFLKNLKKRNLKIYRNESLKFKETLTETTTETTTEKNTDKSSKFSKTATEIVKWFRQLLEEKGVTVFPRDWYIKNYSVADSMLKHTTEAEIREAIQWGLKHDYWSDKIDSLSTVKKYFPKFQMEKQNKVKLKKQVRL